MSGVVAGSVEELDDLRVTEKIIELDSSWFSAEREVKRTKGVHLSHVIDFIEGRKRESEGLSKAGHAFACAGFLWERALDKLIHLSKEELWEYVFTQALFEIDKPDVFRPGEQCMDGGECPICAGKGTILDPVRVCKVCGGVGRIRIYLTPDGISISDLDNRNRSFLEEWKCTSKSCDSDIATSPKFSRWVQWQIPAYLKALLLNTCRLRVYFSKGNYRDIHAPVWKEFILTYSDQEIDETWDSISQHAIIMAKEGLILYG